jgi:hypothetical protein
LQKLERLIERVPLRRQQQGPERRAERLQFHLVT